MTTQAGELGDRLSGLGSSDAERDVAAQVDRWVLEERRATWRQDGGYQGVAALLRTAHEMCVAADEQWDVELGPPAGPYDYFEKNPYHLVAGSYLAAIGCVVGAAQLVRVLEAEVALVSRTASPQLVAH